MFRWTLMILHLSRMRRNVNRNVYNNRKNFSATKFAKRNEILETKQYYYWCMSFLYWFSYRGEGCNISFQNNTKAEVKFLCSLKKPQTAYDITMKVNSWRIYKKKTFTKYHRNTIDFVGELAVNTIIDVNVLRTFSEQPCTAFTQGSPDIPRKEHTRAHTRTHARTYARTHKHTNL